MYDLKPKDIVLNHKVDELGGKIELMIGGLGKLCHAMKDIQFTMPASYVASTSSHAQRVHLVMELVHPVT